MTYKLLWSVVKSSIPENLVCLSNPGINHCVSITETPVRKTLLLGFALLVCTCIWAQRGSIHGKVLNDFTKEPVPFASVYWKRAGVGINSDSAGNFTFS